MKFHRTCPNCAAPIEQIEHGDLVTSTCAVCQWQDECLVARAFPELPRSGLVFLIAHNNSEKVSASALAKLRSVSEPVAKIPLIQLQKQLKSSAGVALGWQAEYRANEIEVLLEEDGFVVERIPEANAAQPIVPADRLRRPLN